jgi:uncharacterized protein DUF4157
MAFALLSRPSNKPQPSAQPAAVRRPGAGGLLQRKCACHDQAAAGGQCEECNKKRFDLQTKLKVSEPGDIFEQEADRIADQVMTTQARPDIGGATPRIQRFVGQPAGGVDAAPASVDGALAGPGRPLESGLRRDMEQRFGYDFSRVRVHHGFTAERSAQDVYAQAYTVGHHMVFGPGSYAPGTHQGQRLIAHELTHVVQQTGSNGNLLHRDPVAIKPSATLTTTDAVLQRAPKDQRKRQDKRLARQLGREDAARIRKSGKLSPEHRQEINANIDFFEGVAKDVYVREIKPSLVKVTPREAPPEIEFTLEETGQAPASTIPFGPLSFGYQQQCRFMSAGMNDLYFAQRLTCPNCHQRDEWNRFAGRRPIQLERVTESKLLEWAALYVWGQTVNRKRFFSLLQRQEDKEFHAIWETQRESALAIVGPEAELGEIIDVGKQVFEGSECARAHFAKYLRANWDTVISRLDQMAIDWLVREIKDAWHLAPRTATLETEPSVIAKLDADKPEKGQIQMGRPFGGSVVTVGFEWGGKRIKSIGSGILHLEVIKYPGIYFQESTIDFQNSQAIEEAIFTDVAKATEGIAVAGKFIKGFFSAAASIPWAVIDTAAKLVDMQTMAVAAFGKATGWYEVGYSCLSSTCRQYKDGVSQRDLVIGAFKDASIVIPLYEQGKECIKGDPEACGGIFFAGAAFAIFPKGKPALEESMIRTTIKRPRTGDVASATETLAEVKPGAPVRTVPKREAPHPQIKTPAPPTAEAIAIERTVHESASKVGSEVKLSDGTHGVASAGKGKEAGFRFCSNHCSLVADRLEQIEQVLPSKSKLRQDINFLKKKVRGLDAEVVKGRMTREMADNAALDIAKGLREQSGIAIFDTLLQMSPAEIRAQRAALKKQYNQAFERAETIAETFAPGENPVSVLEDPSARAKVTDVPAPGPEPKPFLRGNFMHRFADRILGEKSPWRKGKGSLPLPVEAEVVVELLDGTGDIIRADRIKSSAKTGVLLEIKPSGKSAAKGEAQLPGRIEALKRKYPKPEGWTGRVVEYTKADATAWLLAEGVPKKLIPKILKLLGF